MAVNPMLHAGVTGLTQGTKALQNIAEDIAELNLKGDPHTQANQGEPLHAHSVEDVAEAMVSLKLYQRDVQAAAKVVQTADEVLGFLLDVRV